MNDFSLSERHELVDATAELMRLHVLDGIWTEYVADRDSVPSDDLATLRGIVGEMDELLVECGNKTSKLVPLFRNHAEAVNAAVEKIIAEGPLTESERAYWERMVSLHDDAAGLAAWAAESFADSVPRAQEQLRIEMRKLDNGRSSAGDLPPRDNCLALIGLAIGLGAVGFWPIAFGYAAYAGYYCGENQVFA